MADIIFDCPSCKQPVQADDAWAGQQIECPHCKAPMIVPGAQAPQAPAGQPHREVASLGKQLVSVPGENKLKAGATQVARSSYGNVPNIPKRQQVKKESPVAKYAITAAVIVALGAGVYFGRSYIPFLNKNKEEAANAEKAAEEAKAQEEATPPPPKEVPMTPPTYTLDMAKIQISEGKLNGSIAGTNFIPDLVRLDKLGAAYVLNMRQGSGQTPDRGLVIYLRLPANAESPAGQTFTVSPDMKTSQISQVLKVWKPNPRYAATQKPFTSGYALKLEFGQTTESNTVPGKIFVALPDTEKTVVGGTFNATMGQPGQEAVAQPTIQDPQAEANRAAFQKRYGIRR